MPARLLPSLVALALLGMTLPGPAAAAPRVPPGFLGMMADGPLFDPRVDLDAELGAMAGARVGAVRVAIYWDTAQPYASAADVPPDQAARFTDVGGVPTDFAAPDRFVAAAARRGFALLPVVLRTPVWARRRPALSNSAPTAAARAAYGRFLAALVRRYGPRGSFWAANPTLPRRPIRRWQVWNEPAGVRDWAEQPGVPAYVALLREAHGAIKSADPRAQVVLAGLVGRSWEQLERIYRRGGRRWFDATAVHPFSARPANVLKLARLARGVMRRHGDARAPLLITELSWPSSKGRIPRRYGFEQTERGQAARLRSALLELAAARRALHIPAVFWSTWISYDRDPAYPFDYAGLRRLEDDRVVRKPAFFAWQRVARELTR